MAKGDKLNSSLSRCQWYDGENLTTVLYNNNLCDLQLYGLAPCLFALTNQSFLMLERYGHGFTSSHSSEVFW